jgi:hypothetical protein
MSALSSDQPIATMEEFKAALLARRDWNGIAPMQLRMLEAQCRAPECAISPSDLAEQLHIKSLGAATSQYGAFARAIAEKLGYVPPHKPKGAPCWWFTLSTSRPCVGEDGRNGIEWIMRPELVAALRSIRWVA